jgi:SulP family sulfate permease
MVMTRHTLTPKLLTTLREGYPAARLRADAIAGLTVAIVALPLALALAIASGASPDKGLVTAVVAGFLISALGGSRVQIGGPTGAFVVVVFNVIAQHGYDGLLLATMMAGLLLIVAGLLRFGRLIKYIPYPVVTGFTAGIALIIASSQVKDFLGLPMTSVPAEFIAKWQAYVLALPEINWLSLAIGSAALITIVVLRRGWPRLPGFLIAVVLFSAIVAGLQLPVDTIGSRFPELPSGLPMPALPEVSIAKLIAVMPSAFTIAFLAGVEALLSAVVADGMAGTRHRSDQELLAQGIANIASSCFGGLPATGAIARTATNVRAGAKTPVAGMLHALFLLAFVFFGSSLIAFVPTSALAAILLVVAWGMSDIDRLISQLRMPNGDRSVLLLTFALTVLVDLTVAIAVGVTLASFLFMARMAEAVEVQNLGRPDGDLAVEDLHQRDSLPDGVEVFRINGPFFFGVASELLDTLRRVGDTPRVIILRLRLVPLLDATGLQALEEFVQQTRNAGTKVIFSGIQQQPQAMLARVGLGFGSPDVHYAENFARAQALAIELTSR